MHRTLTGCATLLYNAAIPVCGSSPSAEVGARETAWSAGFLLSSFLLLAFLLPASFARQRHPLAGFLTWPA